MARWEPYREMEAMFREIDRTLNFGLSSQLLWGRVSSPGGIVRINSPVDLNEETDRKGMKKITEFLPANWLQATGRLWKNLTNAFKRWFSGWRREKEWSEETRMPMAFFSGDPLIDIQDREDQVIVLAKVPGFGRGDFKMELTGDRLVIRGEKRCSSDGTDHGYYYSERSFGAFARSILLPCEIIPEEARAKYKNGLLRITLPKVERAKVKRVKIRVQG
jgi:HSP20 family protein